MKGKYHAYVAASLALCLSSSGCDEGGSPSTFLCLEDCIQAERERIREEARSSWLVELGELVSGTECEATGDDGVTRMAWVIEYSGACGVRVGDLPDTSCEGGQMATIRTLWHSSESSPSNGSPGSARTAGSLMAVLTAPGSACDGSYLVDSVAVGFSEWSYEEAFGAAVQEPAPETLRTFTIDSGGGTYPRADGLEDPIEEE